MSDFYPSITPVKVQNIPSRETLLDVMVPILLESEQWQAGKEFEEPEWKTAIKTFSRHKTAKDGAMWHGRVSEHSEETTGGWEAVWQGIGVNHTLHEKEYYHELEKAELVKAFNEHQEIWTVYYHLRPPASNRVFTELITTHVSTDEATGLRTGYVMSIPVDISSDPELRQKEFSGTKGAYSAIERVKELPDGGVNWRYTFSSTRDPHIDAFKDDYDLYTR
ncbi:SubName: Full=Uncharacterized protein {ECO:0000313/EMBL:CCA69998.1} [Serendipita indica DSM 11827]|uniref:DUF3074 domain-containing protein n=1 Tax=Serendipita indica (strain DSM 11827) TaxID=1109443 RepID=G4TF98_SERID|nr:SubName: Full=Uncharacterized protein {ECO:0000313/EMBL:CCA69998.1} [Serendipita indica DSM 11827]CCA69998.1 hypothetical protein PIIN_03938 [Serendipita indica DSM 11827]